MSAENQAAPVARLLDQAVEDHLLAANRKISELESELSRLRKEMGEAAKLALVFLEKSSPGDGHTYEEIDEDARFAARKLRSALATHPAPPPRGPEGLRGKP